MLSLGASQTRGPVPNAPKTTRKHSCVGACLSERHTLDTLAPSPPGHFTPGSPALSLKVLEFAPWIPSHPFKRKQSAKWNGLPTFNANNYWQPGRHCGSSKSQTSALPNSGGGEGTQRALGIRKTNNPPTPWSTVRKTVRMTADVDPSAQHPAQAPVPRQKGAQGCHPAQGLALPPSLQRPWRWECLGSAHPHREGRERPGCDRGALIEAGAEE